MALKSKPLRKLDESELRGQILGVAAMMGINQFPSESELIILFDQLKKHFGTFGKDEIEIAFGKAIADNANIHPKISFRMFSQVFNHYKQYRSLAQLELRAEKIRVELEASKIDRTKAAREFHTYAVGVVTEAQEKGEITAALAYSGRLIYDTWNKQDLITLSNERKGELIELAKKNKGQVPLKQTKDDRFYTKEKWNVKSEAKKLALMECKVPKSIKVESEIIEK